MAPVENIKNTVGKYQRTRTLLDVLRKPVPVREDFVGAAHAVSGLRLDVLKHLDDADDARHRTCGFYRNVGFLWCHQSHEVDVCPLGDHFDSGGLDRR